MELAHLWLLQQHFVLVAMAISNMMQHLSTAIFLDKGLTMCSHAFFSFHSTVSRPVIEGSSSVAGKLIWSYLP